MNKRILFIAIIMPFSFIMMGQQIENPGFEEWEDVGTVVDEPVDWNTSKTADNQFIANAAPVTFEMSTDARSGNYALKLYNVSAFGLVATGAICNGRFHADFDLSKSYAYTDTNDARYHMQIGARPDSLAGWFKYFPTDNDKAQFKVILHVDECKLPENGTFDNWVGMAVFQTVPGVTYENWTRFSVPFEYFKESKPEYLLCVINSGDSTAAYDGSYLLADDIELIYSTSAGISEPARPMNFLRVSGRDIEITLESEKSFLGAPFRISDMNGRSVYVKILDSRVIRDIPKDIPTGLYIGTMGSGNNRYSQKFLLGQ